MNILITGSQGYIGSKLALALREKGHKIERFDRPADILNEKQLKKAIEKVDVVFHLAALAEINYTDAHPQETFDTNIIGAGIVARLCTEKNIKLHFVSTCCIYGDPLESPSVEDRLINPTDLYAMSKASGEYIVKMWGLKGLKFNILRFGTVYGQSLKPTMRNDMAIQKFVQAAIDKQPIIITGDGSQARNFIHIDDLVRAMVLLNDSDVVGETINLAGSEKISINDIAEYAKKFGVTDISYTSDRKDDFKDQNVSLEKAKRLINWEPEITFEQGITDYYNWLIKQQ